MDIIDHAINFGLYDEDDEDTVYPIIYNGKWLCDYAVYKVLNKPDFYIVAIFNRIGDMSKKPPFITNEKFKLNIYNKKLKAVDTWHKQFKIDLHNCILMFYENSDVKCCENTIILNGES